MIGKCGKGCKAGAIKCFACALITMKRDGIDLMLIPVAK